MRVSRPLIAFLLVLLVAVTPALPAGAAGTGGAPTPGATGSKPIETVVVHADGRRYVLKVWVRKTAKRCLPHAYGRPVRHFLRTHRCRGLTRWLVTTKVNGRGVGFAQSAVGFRARTANAAYRAAGRFRDLVSRNGTGNFYSLFHDGYHLPAGPQFVPDPDAFKALAQDSGVTIVDAWYLHGETPRNAKPLERMARDIYLQWF